MVAARQPCMGSKRSIGWVHQGCWDCAMNVHLATYWISIWSPRLHMVLGAGAGVMPVVESGPDVLGHSNGSAQIKQQFSSKQF